MSRWNTYLPNCNLETKVLIALLVALAMSPNCLSAQTILWDQQPDVNLGSGAVVNQEFVDASEFNTYQVNDATFATSVIVDSDTVYFTNNSTFWPTLISEGVLNIFDGDALLSSDDPTIGGDFGQANIGLDIANIGINTLAVTANDLNIQLNAGTYWFGLSATVPDPNFFFQEFTRNTVGQTVGQESRYRNPGGAFGFGTDWAPSDELFEGYRDVAFTVSGEIVPEPSTSILLLLVFGGVAFRRTR